jgi:hypothetical protein
VHIEILTFEGCPNALATRDIVAKAVLLEGVDARIEMIDVASPEEALRMRFVGSPSVRINGTDVERSARDRTDCGFMCRTYRHGADVLGTPPISLIRESIREASQERCR